MLSDIEAIDRVIKLINDAVERAQISLNETENTLLQTCYRNYIHEFQRTRTTLFEFKKLLNNGDLVIENPTKE